MASLEEQYRIAKKYFEQQWQRLPLELQVKTGLPKEIAKIESLYKMQSEFDKIIGDLEYEINLCKYQVCERYEKVIKYEQNKEL